MSITGLHRTDIPQARGRRKEGIVFMNNAILIRFSWNSAKVKNVSWVVSSRERFIGLTLVITSQGVWTDVNCNYSTGVKIYAHFCKGNLNVHHFLHNAHSVLLFHSNL